MVEDSTLSSNGRFDSRQDLQTVATSLLAIKEPAKPTNTIIATNIPPAFFEPADLQRYRESINNIAETVTWVPLKSFMRIVMSFATTDDSIKVRKMIDKKMILGRTTHVFYGESIEADARHASNRLEVPALEKNWLISPPGSPPVGWTQIREDAPNSQALHEDLISALQALSHDYKLPDNLESNRTSRTEGQLPRTPSSRSSGITVLQNEDDSTPAIVVHLEESNSADVATRNGVGGLERTKVSMVKTPMPGH